jgi:hypothetical protein
MRTTLTLDDDVAVALERLRKARNAGHKKIVNDVLRRGLKGMNAPSKPRQAFRTTSVSLGPLRLPDVDNIGEVLAVAEGEPFK